MEEATKMADYLLVCDPEKFAEKFPDIDPCDDLGLRRMNVLGREVLFARYFSTIYEGKRFPDGYDRERLVRLLPYDSTKSNKHEFAQSVLSDEDTLRLRLTVG
jgi:hypothetical protein